jgi:hypothetical protein
MALVRPAWMLSIIRISISGSEPEVSASRSA